MVLIMILDQRLGIRLLKGSVFVSLMHEHKVLVKCLRYVILLVCYNVTMFCWPFCMFCCLFLSLYWFRVT